MFLSRVAAGKQLAQRLLQYREETEAQIFGLARGGVVVAHAIAQELSLPLAALVVKKLSAPIDPELAIGALAPNGITYLDQHLIRSLNVGSDYIRKEIERKQKELTRQLKLFNSETHQQQSQKKYVIVVDDGIATGASINAAIQWVKHSNPYKIIVAVPVVARDIASVICAQVDRCKFLETPNAFSSVGDWYTEYRQVSDDEVVQLLKS